MDTICEFSDDKMSGNLLEIDEELFYYFLDVLPPVHMSYLATVKNTMKTGTIKIEASFGFAEGMEYVTAFWCGKCLYKDHYFAQLTTEINRC